VAEHEQITLDALIDVAVASRLAPLRSPSQSTQLSRVDHLFERAALLFPERPAVRDCRRRLSWLELWTEADRVAALLRTVAPRGGVVAIQAAPSVSAAIAFVGALSGGFSVAPLDPSLRPHLLKPLVEALHPAIVVGESEDSSVLAMAHPCPREARSAGDMGARVALLFATSGSTSHPKAVVCPHAPVLFAVDAILRRLQYKPDDVVAGLLPFAFDYGCYQLFLAASVGAEVVLLGQQATPRLSGVLTEERVTVLPAVPSIGQILLRTASRPGVDLHRLRLVTNTGAALSPQLAADIHRATGAAVLPMYGLTECKRVSIGLPNEHVTHPGSVGRPLDGTCVFAVDDAGVPLPPGGEGELVVCGPHVMGGYLDARALTEARFRTSDPQWPRLMTGDLGRVEEDGRIYLAGRRDDVYKQNGFRISSLEIEGAALSLAGTRAAACLPANASHSAVLVVAADEDAPHIARALADLVGPERVPPRIRVCADLPLTANGKIDRKALAATENGSYSDEHACL